jgi:chromosome segregation ATPase
LSTEGEEPSAGQASPSADALPQAYEQRTAQLYEARTALAEAVSTLRTELWRRNEECDHAIAENRALRERIDLLESELRNARADITALRGMKVVRWTAWPRLIVYRIRARRG